MRDYAQLLKEKGRIDESFELTRDAMELARRTFGADHHWTLELRFYLGAEFLRAGCYSEAEEMLKAISQVGLRVRGATHAAAASYLAVHSYALLRLGAYNDAEKGLRRSLQILGGADGQLTRDAAWSLRQLVASLAAQRKKEEARPFAERLLELRRIDAAEPDADAWRLNTYARELLTVYPPDLRDPEQALEVALMGYQLSSDEYHYNRYTVALAYEANGLIEEAIQFAESALAHSPIEDSSERAEYERLLVRLYQNGGQPDAAERVYRNVLSARRKQFGDSHEDVASALFGLATVLVNHGKHSEAEDVLRECLWIRESAIESREDLSCPMTTVCRTIETIAVLSKLLESRGRLSEADECTGRAIAHVARQRSCHSRTVERV